MSLTASGLKSSVSSANGPRQTAARIRSLQARAEAGLSLSVSDSLGPSGDAVLAVARTSGAPLVPSLRALAEVSDRHADQADRIQESLAGPQMARRIILALPAVAIPLTGALGFDVVGVLLDSPLGWALIGLAVALTWVGAQWSTRLVAAATRMPGAPGLYARLLAVALSAGVGLTRARAVTRHALAESGLLLLLDTEEVRVTDEVIEVGYLTGVPVVRLLQALDRQQVEQVFLAAQIRARQLAEKLLMPLGACTLPAFLLLGVVPAMVSVVSSTTLQF
jgi:tight adherence protein B